MYVNLTEVISILMIFQLFVFSVFLFIKRKHNLASLFLGIHLFSQGMGVFGFLFNLNKYLFENYTHLSFIGYPFIFLWGPTFYFYVRSFAFSDFKLKWKNIIHAVPFLAIVIYLLVVFYFHSAEIKRQLAWSLIPVKNNLAFSISFYIQLFIYIIASLYVLKDYSKRLKQHFSSIEKINLNWLKLIIIYFAAGYFSQFLYLIPFINKFISANLFQIIFNLIYLTFFNIIFFKSWGRQDIFIRIEEKEKYKSSNLTRDEAAKWIEKLNTYMCVSKPFLNPGLTINQIADEIDISPRILSQIINEYFSQNFYDYISSFRIEEAKKMLSEPENKKTILGIIYETGYNSKSAFNLAFKKSTGFTPTEYKKKFAKISVSSEQE